MVIGRFSTFLLAFCLAAPALAADLAGVPLADEVWVGGQTLVLNGAGVASKPIFKNYVGSLYVPQKVRDIDGVLVKDPRRIQMNLLRDLTVN